MAVLTVNSLSITPGASWPLDSTAAIIAARTSDNRPQLIAQGDGLPSSIGTEGTWSGTPSVQTDFSP